MPRPIALMAAVVLLAGCGGGDEKPKAISPPPAPQVPAEKEVAAAGFGDGLAVGIQEQNPNLIDPARGDPAFVPWAERLVGLKPAVHRVVVDWAGLQPDPGKAADLAQPRDGCLRTTPPCAPYGGLRDHFRAIGAAKVPVIVTFHGVPEWAAAQAHGCERPNIEPRSRPITDRGLLAYKRLIRQVADTARQQGADVRWWSVWNEPNGPFFISPQRARCDTSSPPVSVRPYARLARAMREELKGLPGDPQLVVGELAGVAKAGPRGSGVGEFLSSLPEDVLCGADILAQHEYAELPEDDDDKAEPVREAREVLGERCPGKDIPIWITETGIGGPRAGQERPTGSGSLRRQCQAYHRQLRRWHEDPRVQVAIQYTFREDTAFPVGLADAGLTRTYPTLRMLQAWGDRKPDEPPPALPADCQAG